MIHSCEGGGEGGDLVETDRQTHRQADRQIDRQTDNAFVCPFVHRKKATMAKRLCATVLKRCLANAWSANYEI